MERFLNSTEERLFDLIETKDYIELTPAEKKLVDQHLTEAEFTARRKVLKNASALFDDEPIVVPHPLVLNQPKTSSFLSRTIPLYQVLLAAAVVTLLVLVIPFTRTEAEKIKTEYIVQHDTVEVEKIIHDTVVSVKEKRVPVEKIVYVNTENATTYAQPAPRLFEAGPAFAAPALEQEIIQNNGNSLREEPTAVLIRDFMRQ